MAYHANSKFAIILGIYYTIYILYYNNHMKTPDSGSVRTLHLFPRGHLFLAGGITFLTAIPLILWPSSEVSATRHAATGQVSIPLEVPTEGTRVAVAHPLFAPETGSQETPPQETPPARDTQNAGATDAERRARPTTISKASPSRHQEELPWKRQTVRSGDSLSTIFKRLGLNGRDVHEVMNSGKEAAPLRRLLPGETVAVRKDRNGQLQELEYRRSRLESIQVRRDAKGLRAEHVVREPDILTNYGSGPIRSSLFLDGRKAGLSDQLIMELAAIFGWDIDFALDIREGDSFGVLFEERYLDGEKIDNGGILAAHFTNRDKTFTAVRYTDTKGNTDYYTPDGHSMRKEFLRTPVEFSRISSRFNLRRRHPILHTIRAHKGVDYAAPMGTPVRAAGDGKIRLAGNKGGYGRTVIIQHGERYSTLYAHLKNFRRGIRNGARVKQGQVIGYVGKSGLATGPHLHYEFHVHGVHKNPLTVKFPKARPIPAKEKKRFMAQAEKLVARLNSLRESSQLALNTSDR